MDVIVLSTNRCTILSTFPSAHFGLVCNMLYVIIMLSTQRIFMRLFPQGSILKQRGNASY